MLMEDKMFGFSKKDKAEKRTEKVLLEITNSLAQYSGIDIWKLPDNFLTPFNIQIHSQATAINSEYNEYDFACLFFWQLALLFHKTGSTEEGQLCLDGLVEYLEDNRYKISPEFYEKSIKNINQTLPK